MNPIVSVEYRISNHPNLAQFHSHEAFEIYMFHEGICRYFVNHQIVDLEPGDILLINGLVLHRPNIVENAPYIRSHVHFDPDTIRNLLYAVKADVLLDVFDHQHCLLRSDNQEELQKVEHILARMNEVTSSTSYTEAEKEWELPFLLGQLLVHLRRFAESEEVIPYHHSSIKSEHAEKIARFIQTNFADLFTITDIAKHLCLHKSYVSHVFKEMTGYTIMEYVMHTRLKHARYILEAKADMSIEQVAYESGFESPSHFSRYFKSKVGMSPKDYRKKRLEIFQRRSSVRSLRI